MAKDDRTVKHRKSLTHAVSFAREKPDKVVDFGRRWARDLWFLATTRNHVDYYRTVMRSDTARNPEKAVGSRSHTAWLKNGQNQFEFLTMNGLEPHHRYLEIGCGNLRAGWRIIQYLDTGNYYGIDISPDILFAAQQTIVTYKLQYKTPHLTPVRNLTFDFLPDEFFDVIHAHSVFSHTPLETIDECLSNVGRVLRSDGFFDFTFNRTMRREHQVLREDYYFHLDTLLDLATSKGLRAELLEHWSTPSQQQKIRVRQSS